MLTLEERNMLERVLLITGRPISFQQKYVSFKNALALSKLKSLRERSQILKVKLRKKSCIQETKNLSTDADSRTDTIMEKLRD